MPEPNDSDFNTVVKQANTLFGITGWTYSVLEGPTEGKWQGRLRTQRKPKSLLGFNNQVIG